MKRNNILLSVPISQGAAKMESPAQIAQEDHHRAVSCGGDTCRHLVVDDECVACIVAKPQVSSGVWVATEGCSAQTSTGLSVGDRDDAKHGRPAETPGRA